MFVLHDVSTVLIGIIPNASLTLASSSFANTTIGTTQYCLCTMMTSSDISAINCFSNNTCERLSDASLINTNFSWIININVNGLLYIRYLPVRSELSTSYTTAIATPYTSALTSTAAILAAGKHNVFWLSRG